MRVHCLSTAFFAAALALNAQAADTLQITNAWVRATPPKAPVAGAFLEIRNNGKNADRLRSVSTDAAKRVEIHEMRMHGEVMQMRQITEGLPIPAGQRVVFNPGSYHLMLIAPSKAIVEGQRILMTLNFEKAGDRQMTFIVAKQAPQANTAMMHDHQHH